MEERLMHLSAMLKDRDRQVQQLQALVQTECSEREALAAKMEDAQRAHAERIQELEHALALANSRSPQQQQQQVMLGAQRKRASELTDASSEVPAGPKTHVDQGRAQALLQRRRAASLVAPPKVRDLQALAPDLEEPAALLYRSQDSDSYMQERHVPVRANWWQQAISWVFVCLVVLLDGL
eukprot:m51a1_g8020 hypothetical protein (181) ;mRNA; f:206818-216842